MRLTLRLGLPSNSRLDTPTRIEVRADGSVVAWYDDAPLLKYHSLEDLLSRHGLTRRDLVEAIDD